MRRVNHRRIDEKEFMTAHLFGPFHLDDLILSNRMVMAPMTRNRADQNGNVTPLMVTYYQQRASAGLIVAESTAVSPDAVGYPFVPGLYTDEQAQSWLSVTNAVHSAGGRIFVQLQHCGRISHPSLQPAGVAPVAPSPIQPAGQAVTYTGARDFVTPRELETNEIPSFIAKFQHAAAAARRAGFDGVEVHAGNGYLIDQFLRDGTNRREDSYGGSVQKRMRFLSEIIDAVCDVWPSSRVGVRLTPENSFNSMSDSDPQGHFSYFLKELNRRSLAYVHLLEGDIVSQPPAVDYRALRSSFRGCYVAGKGYDLNSAKRAVGEGSADLVAFGIPFLANPDLVRRYREALPLNSADPATFYGGGERGYTDYPFFPSESQ